MYSHELAKLLLTLPDLPITHNSLNHTYASLRDTTAVSSNQVNLTWTESPNAVGVVGYKIFSLSVTG
jgi:hypothetical protein